MRFLRFKKVWTVLVGVAALIALITALLTGLSFGSDSFVAVEETVYLFQPLEEDLLQDGWEPIYLCMISVLIVILKGYHIVRGPPYFKWIGDWSWGGVKTGRVFLNELLARWGCLFKGMRSRPL